MMPMDFNIILFDDYETLDAFGPAEIIGRIPDYYRLQYFSSKGGLIPSRQNVRVETLPIRQLVQGGILLIPGGQGTRTLVNKPDFINSLATLAQDSSFVLTVCTGSALLAKTGLLDGRKATSNKRAFNWVLSLNDKVGWVKAARWVVDGNIYTSSGVSAGMDMVLGFVSDNHGIHIAQDICQEIEYIWNSIPEDDPFSADLL